MSQVTSNKKKYVRGSLKGEISTTGLKTAGGVIYENTQDKFRYPLLIETCEEMMNDETIYTAINAIKSLIRTVDWGVKYESTADLSDQQKDRLKFIESCMEDMETSWSDFVNEAVSFIIYGFSLHEKVWKVRGENNSRYPDGKWGWKNLPPRAQNTITEWHFDSKLRKIEKVIQNVSGSYGPKGTPSQFVTDQEIPYKRLLHFKHDSQKGNPEGSTPLKACYLAYKYKNTIAEFEGIGVSRDFQGVPVIGCPPEYLSEDADEDKKAVFEYFKEAIRNLHMNESAGVVIPRYIDPESKTDLFSFELASANGSKSFDTDKILTRYENKILMAFLADGLKLGNDGIGSLALADNKTAMMAVFVESILKEFLNIINDDLIPHTALMNGWDISQELPKIFHGDLDERDLDKLGAYIQRGVSVGAIEVDKGLSDELRRIAKLPPTNYKEPIKEDYITPALKDKDSETDAGKRTADPNNSLNGSTSRTSSSKQSGVST